MELGDLLVEMLGENIDLVFIAAMIRPQLDLRQHLVGKGRTHYKARMPGGAAKIDEPSLGKDDQPLAVGEDDLVDLRLDFLPDVIAQRADLDLAVKVADVADDRAVVHLTHVVEGD